MIDLKRGCYQMPLADESRACTAMTTPLGLLQWKVMPMGVTNGNAAFQQILKTLLDRARDCADPFVDDVIIVSREEGAQSRLDKHDQTKHGKNEKQRYSPSTGQQTFTDFEFAVSDDNSDASKGSKDKN